MPNKKKVSKMAASSKLSDEDFAEFLGVPVNQKLDFKMLMKALNYERSTIRIGDDFYSSKKADDFITDNEILITALGKDILTESEISNILESVFGNNKQNEVIISVLNNLIISAFKQQLKRDFSFLEKFISEIKFKTSTTKIDAGHIFYDIKRNNTFVNFEKFKYYLSSFISPLKFSLLLLNENNSDWIREYAKLNREHKFLPSKDDFKLNVINVIQELKSKGTKLTQEIIAIHLGYKRTTLIEKCKSERFILPDLIKAFK
ncbi:MAG: hypothetical protein IH949_12890 [Bacteroidetes bacterium]|nr:hypothetical protein [Bacteroidota bacterium]